MASVSDKRSDKNIVLFLVLLAIGYLGGIVLGIHLFF